MYIRGIRGQVPVLFDEGSYYPAIGKAVWVREGADATIVSAGVMTIEALQAADELLADGIHAGVLHSPSIKPLDAEAIVAAARSTGIVVTAENHSIIGGLGSAVAELLMESSVAASFARVGVRDTFAEGGSPNYLFEKYGLSARHVAATVRRLCQPGAGTNVDRSVAARERSGSKGV
jgi:transketolase